MLDYLPEFLMFAGEEDDSELAGFAWLVKAPADEPPEGFTGDNDWWHRHSTLFPNERCWFMERISLSRCSDRNGENAILDEYWMAHVNRGPWLTRDVFTNHHPCLKEGDGPRC